MKALQLYVCEKCGTQYKDKAACKKCEESHKVPVKITGMRYLSLNQNKPGYPIEISVQMEDGTTMKYRR